MAESADKSPSANSRLDEESDVVELTDEVAAKAPVGDSDGDEFESMDLEMPEFKVPGQEKQQKQDTQKSNKAEQKKVLRKGKSGATERLSQEALERAAKTDSSKLSVSEEGEDVGEGEEVDTEDNDTVVQHDGEQPEYDRQAMVKTIQMEAVDRSTIEGIGSTSSPAMQGLLDDARLSPEIIPFPPQVLVKKWREGLPGEVELIVGNDITTAAPKDDPEDTEGSADDAESLPDLPADSTTKEAKQIEEDVVELAEEDAVEVAQEEVAQKSGPPAPTEPADRQAKSANAKKRKPKKGSPAPQKPDSQTSPPGKGDSEMKGLVQELMEEEKEQRARRTARIRPRDVWFQKVFTEDYLRTVPPDIVEITQGEADFIEASLRLKKKSRVLDLACGFGRHSIELANRGYDMVGLDLSMPLLQRALDAAKKRSLNVKFIHGDMRELNFSGVFDGCVIWDTSLGYFDDRTNLGVLQGVSRGLKVGGRLLIDVVNRDFVVNQTPTRLWWEGNGCIFLEESEFDYQTSTLEVQRSYIFEDGTPPMEHTSFIRLYNLHELRQMLHVAGFKVVEVSGGQHYRGHFLGTASERIIVLAEKRKKRKPSK